MSQTETVKVELEIPKNVLEATKKVCSKFDYDFNKMCVEAIAGDVEASADSHFEDFCPPVEDVPLMVDPKTAVYLKWWFMIARKFKHYPTISEFLIDCGRKFIHPYIKDPTNFTDEEAALLGTMKKEAGIEDQTVFSHRILELLKS